MNVKTTILFFLTVLFLSSCITLKHSSKSPDFYAPKEQRVRDGYREKSKQEHSKEEKNHIAKQSAEVKERMKTNKKKTKKMHKKKKGSIFVRIKASLQNKYRK